MLHRDAIRQLLLHEDEVVRREAGAFFSTCSNPPQDISDAFWSSFDRYGIEGSCLGFAYDSIELTAASCDRVVNRVAGRVPANEWYTLTGAFERVPMEYLLANRERLLEISKTVPAATGNKNRLSTHDHLLRRLELRESRAEDLWNELALLANRIEDNARSQWDPRTDQRLYEALLRHPQFTLEKSLATIDSGNKSWVGVFALDLLAKLKHRPSIPLFLSLLNSDGDCEREAATHAIRSMADADIIRTLQQTYAAAGELHRVMIAEVLGEIGLPESEGALLTLLESDDVTPEDRAWLSLALLRLLTTRGFDALRQIATDGNYDTGVLKLRRELPWLALATGQELPEADEWDRQFEAEQREHLDSLAWSDTVHLCPPGRLEADKVGRNDPCPCGSGKKYKKCCLR